MTPFEYDYKNLLLECLNNGELTDNRTELKTLKLFNAVSINVQLTAHYNESEYIFP